MGVCKYNSVTHFETLMCGNFHEQIYTACTGQLSVYVHVLLPLDCCKPAAGVCNVFTSPAACKFHVLFDSFRQYQPDTKHHYRRLPVRRGHMFQRVHRVIQDLHTTCKTKIQRNDSCQVGFFKVNRYPS